MCVCVRVCVRACVRVLSVIGADASVLSPITVEGEL